MAKTNPTTIYESTKFAGCTNYNKEESWGVNADSDGELYFGIYYEGDDPKGSNFKATLVLTVEEAKKLRKHLKKAIVEAEYVQSSPDRSFRKEEN
ncbi:TPA: hypothetical protein QCX06_002145 [Bacillus paranthracis]|nr:hypothetical protein [Bacillus paranthracis]HDR7304542.1 hypothetical protein [Bacillus paranthracis]